MFFTTVTLHAKLNKGVACKHLRRKETEKMDTKKPFSKWHRSIQSQFLTMYAHNIYTRYNAINEKHQSTKPPKHSKLSVLNNHKKLTLLGYHSCNSFAHLDSFTKVSITVSSITPCLQSVNQAFRMTDINTSSYFISSRGKELFNILPLQTHKEKFAEFPFL